MYISKVQVSVGMLTSVVSLIDGFCVDLCGHVHCGVDVVRVENSIPLEYDQQDRIEMTHAYMLLKMVLLESC